MEKSRANRLLAVLVALNLLLILVLGSWLIYDHNHTASFSGQSMQQASKYTIYVGTNDQTTNTQKIPTEKVQEQMDAICEKQVQGFTVFHADGNWYDAKGTKVRENTLVYCFYNATDKQIKSILDQALTTFNQSAIVLEKTDADITFYSGGK
jgi:hypothetical protein